MKIEKISFNLLTILMLYLSSGFAWAVEKEAASSISYWPIILLLGLLFVLRKKLIAEATIQKHDDEHSPAKKAQQTATNKPAVTTSTEVTDLTQSVDQCQGATAKGARCSRTSNLEAVVVKIDNKKYKFLSCKQHKKGFTSFHFR